MTDYQEEQNNEIEALASIYPDEFTVLSTEPHCFEIRLKSDNADEDDEDTVVQATLQVTYTPTYPDESPDIEVTFSSNLDDEDLTSLLNLCQEQAEENLGMVMVFTIVSAVQEKLNEKVDLLKKQILEEEERAEEAKKAKEEAEMAKKFVGTPVTIETFLAWKSKFDQEKTSSRKNLDSNEDSKKLTGRQLFEEDNTLDDSEVALLDEGDNIVVDESLFQELDDLDLDDELDEAIGEDD
ncbi:RWD domain-containing protein 1-like [Ptychodera flava]|uniref:RWD domain-containing protein 1-like n=1 Tax=Ptychodera flava TaxID=63121 RepID=UPI00396A5C8F